VWVVWMGLKVVTDLVKVIGRLIFRSIGGRLRWFGWQEDQFFGLFMFGM
jgi:hypothetical protein